MGIAVILSNAKNLKNFLPENVWGGVQGLKIGGWEKDSSLRSE